MERQLAGSGKLPAKSGSKGALANGEAGGKGGFGLRRVLPPILLQAFVLTFLAEWGDRSQARACSNRLYDCGGSSWRGQVTWKAWIRSAHALLNA